jgi:hypothetical protein
MSWLLTLVTLLYLGTCTAFYMRGTSSLIVFTVYETYTTNLCVPSII